MKRLVGLDGPKAHLDEHGYCVVEGAISAAAAAALRERLVEQAAAEPSSARPTSFRTGSSSSTFF